MQSLLINIRGTNGSGKSTIPRAIIRHDGNIELREIPMPGQLVTLVVCHNLQFIFVGKYHTQCGGLDSIDTTAHAEEAIWCAARQRDCAGYTIVFEGILASTVKSTYARIMCELRDCHWELKPIVLFLMPPVEVCLDRVKQRNGGKPINEELVIGKYNTLLRQYGYFAEHGIKESVWDNSSTPKNRVGPKFVNMTQKWRERYVDRT